MRPLSPPSKKTSQTAAGDGCIARIWRWSLDLTMTARFIPGVRDVDTLIGHTVCDRRVRLWYGTRMVSNLLVTIPVITIRAFRRCLFCSPVVSDRPNSSLSTKMGPLSINPFRLPPTFSGLSLFLSVWITRSNLAWTGPCRLFLQVPFRFVPQCNSP